MNPEEISDYSVLEWLSKKQKNKTVGAAQFF